LRPAYRFERAVTFDPTVGSTSNFYRNFLNFLQEFLQAVFLIVDVEALLGEAEVSTLETSVPVRKGRNFGSDRWIAHKFLKEFPKPVFRIVDVESLLGEAEVSQLETSVLVRKGRNF